MIAIVVFLLIQGCGIKLDPWDRGHLAKPTMAITPYPNHSALREHVFTSKEASQGGYGGIGGGCGCN
ncbi:MAG: DUF4266 domain-containing protein [Methylococcaceae bacterium]|nr:DUF4266 domain-containing protein [Methylococcaceae bacterium]